MTLHRQTPRLGITAAMRREEARPSGWARGGEGAEMRSVHVTPHTAHTPAARLGTGTLGSLRQRCGPGPRGARVKAAPALLHGAGDPGRAVPAFRRRVARGRLAGTASAPSSGRCWRPRLPHSGGRRAGGRQRPSGAEPTAPPVRRRGRRDHGPEGPLSQQARGGRTRGLSTCHRFPGSGGEGRAASPASSSA